ncbi:MAG: flippase [bacterium]|nr:flippase [bacterium]
MAAYSVTKNTSFLTAASILQKVISFLYFTFVARAVGVENTGKYFFAISFTTIFAVVADFGLAPLLTREAARYPDRTEEYLSTVFIGKLIFGLVAIGLVGAAINLLGYAADIRELVYLSALTMWFDNLQTTFYSVLRARKNLVFESVAIVVAQLLTMIIGTVSIIMGAPLIWLIVAYTIPSFLNFLYAGVVVRRVYSIHYSWLFNRDIFKIFVYTAWPFALAGLLGRLYSYSDAIMMSKLLPAEALGWWSVPYKIIFAFQFIPAALSASVYPVMSELFVSDPTKIGSLFLKSWRYLFIVVLPLAFGLMVFAEPIIIKLYRADYLPSVPVLRILAVSLIFSFLAFINGATLNATNRQKTQTALLAVTLVFNLVLNYWLIPGWGIIGAAWAALASSILLCGGGLYFASRGINLSIRQLGLSKWNQPSL